VSRDGKPPPFFVPHSTCQISGLGFLYELFFGRREDGHFVEVGAFDGVSFSNSSCLADRGWSGILVEPVPQFATAARTRYRDNSRIHVVQKAIGDSSGRLILNLAGTLTTGDPDLRDAYSTMAWAKDHVSRETIEVEQVTLDDLLDEMMPSGSIDVLIVDVEGLEPAVFAGFDVERWRPAMIIVELTETHPDLSATRRQNAELSKHLLKCGYEVAYKDQINTVFVETGVAGARYGLTDER
jgi:FkbM family methyltransferase